MVRITELITVICLRINIIFELFFKLLFSMIKGSIIPALKKCTIFWTKKAKMYYI